MRKRIVAFGAVALLAVLPACGNQVEEAIDCDDVCDAFEACLDADTVECRAACQGEPDEEIEACEACLDGEATCDDCLVECAPLAS